MKTIKRYAQLFPKIIGTALSLCLLASVGLASAPPSDFATSNTLQMSDWVTLMAEEEAQSVSVQIRWLPTDDSAPTSLTAVLDAGDTQAQAALSRANAWSATMDVPLSGGEYTASLLGTALHYTTEISGTDVLFTVYTDAEGGIPEAASPQVQTVERRTRIVLASDADTPLAYGDIITLEAALEGYDDVSPSLQWQVDAGDGWQNIEGANGAVYSFTLDEDSEYWRIRLSVEVNETAE